MGVAAEVLVRLAVCAAKRHGACAGQTESKLPSMCKKHGTNVRPRQFVQLPEVVEKSVLDQITEDITL